VRVSRQGEREDDKFRSPAFQREAIERFAIEAGELAGVIVAKLDRLSRLPPAERIALFERVEGAGGVVLSASEPNDVSTPEGRFVRELFLALARMEFEKKRDGFTLAKQNAIASGVAVKRRAPFGYRFDRRHALERDPAAAVTLRELFELRDGGASYGEVLTHFEQATGRSSSRQTMRDLLTNRAYLGELHYGHGERALANAEAHEPLISEALFERVQAMNEERRRGRVYKAGRPVTLLAGIAQCVGCGKGLVRSPNGRRPPSYKCPQDTRHCTARASIYEHELDEYVIAEVLKWAEPVADLEVEVSLALKADLPPDREQLEAALAEAEQALGEWATSTRLQESLDLEVYLHGLEARQELVRARRVELQELGERSAFAHARATVREILTGPATVEERRRLLGVVLGAVLVRRTPFRGAPALMRARLLYASESIDEQTVEFVEQAVA
jgi:DNA invertase Pin-like site-specific DNA recombinase